MNMSTDSQIYRQLQIQLDKYPIGYPATQSGVEIDILKYFFYPASGKDCAVPYASVHPR